MDVSNYFIEECISDISKLLGEEVEILFSRKDRNIKKLDLSDLDSGAFIDTVFFHVITAESKLVTSLLISTFGLIEMPGCCGMLISTAAEVSKQFRNKGIGDRLHKFRKELAHQMSYSVLLCTDVDSNVPQRTILENNGWKKAHSFVNFRTNNLVNISVCDLT